MKVLAIICIIGSVSVVACSVAHEPQIAASARNQPPRVTIVSPQADSLFRGARTSFRAEATDVDGFVRRVDFFVDSRRIGSDEKSPYMVGYQPVTDGTIRVVAVAWDDNGASTASPTTFIVRDCPSGQTCTAELTSDDLECCIDHPVVHWVSPKPGKRNVDPATVTLEVTASVANDSISEVEFFANDRLLGTVREPPFRYEWSGVQPGRYSVTARARTTQGVVGDSDVNTIAVEAN